MTAQEMWIAIRYSLIGAQVPAGFNALLDGLCDGSLRVVPVAQEHESTKDGN